MIKNEWKSLWNNKILIIVVMAIIIIPVIYAGLFLKSMWDPYGNLDQLPVAVVNNDKSVEYDGKTLSVGSDMVDELKDNDALDFHFVDSEEAEQGLKNGTYYMVITIPEDFSKDASTLMDDNPKKMELKYETNPGTNYIASKMSESALSKIREAVASKVTETYTQTVFDQIATVGDGMQAAAGMNSAADTIRTASSGISQAASQLQGVSAPVSKAADSMAGVVQQCAQDANAQIEAANGQISAANQQTEAANAVITNASAALQAIQGQADENGMISAESLSAVIGSLAGADAGVSGVSGIDADAYTGQAQQIAASAAEQIAGAQSTLNSTASQLEQAASGLNSGADTLGSKAGEMSSGASQMQAGANEMEEGISSMPEVPSDPINAVSAAVDQLCAGSQKVNAGTTSVASALSTLESGTKDFSKVAAGVKALNAGFETLTANDETLTSGAASLKAAGSSVTGGINQLTNGGKTLADGVNTLSAGLKTYTSGVSTLAENNSALTGGTSQLAEGAKTLASGAEQLASGTKTLHDGTSKLVSNNNKLNRGAEQLSDGAGQIQDGSSQLYDGSKELGDGMTKLEDGSDTLATSLGDGAAQVKETKASDDTISMFATPITDEETKITTVENNGHAMAPYMMSVGLWVGCLAFCLMYPLTEYKGKLKSGFAWWASKASVLYPVAILQGVLLILLLRVFDGFTPVEMTKTILFAALTGACFTSIMYFFNITFGKVGSFLMLIFMVVQLAGSAGTYPVEISPDFVAKIHYYLPFTYTVNAFRSTICGGESIHQSVVVLIGLTIIFSILTILQFNHMARRKKQGKMLLLDWLEEKGVA